MLSYLYLNANVVNLITNIVILDTSFTKYNSSILEECFDDNVLVLVYNNND